MKKIKILLLVVLGIVSLFSTVSIYAENDDVPLVKLFDKNYIDRNTTKVLNQGYYIFGSLYGEEISKKDFIGDLSTYFFSSEQEIITVQDFKSVLGMDLEETFFQRTLIDPFMNSFGKDALWENGVYFVRVYSNGAFSSGVHDYTNLTAYGLVTSSPKPDKELAGNKTHIISVDHPLEVEEIKDRYLVMDNVDGDITSLMTFDTNYKKGYFDIGTYYVYVTATDSKNNKTTAMDIVQVIDFVPPQLHLSKEIHEIEVHTPFTTEDAKTFFSATDNFSTGGNLAIRYTDLYQDQFHTVGTYKISAYAIDHGNNQSETKEMEIHVVDKTKPVITLTAGGDTIVSNHILSDGEIKALLQVTDNYDTISNNAIEIISNTCNGNQGVEFEITVQVTDNSGNEGKATFTYILTDTTAPIIMVKKTIYIPLGTTYTNEQIIQMLKEAGIINKEATHIDITSPITSFEHEGIYSISFTETLNDGTTQEGTASITIFRPIDSPKNNSNTSISPWYYALMILPMVLVIPFIFIKRKHEKN